ncbi:hypothetical protein [Natronolimnobius baerhuensis]|uniref:Uncharacterized protein n=1 Tax=Natronolimnobius baerhuensis TaxID=253108 RepID=A0A202ECX9_9EURY|nr:hypothetical protein [Natronolimnobius baerhuensis]OVE86089.1 hypothetical protein B2G88_04655 [Natronolimnobius baerhuensis]
MFTLVALIVGLMFIVFGLAGVHYAPAVVKAQDRLEVALFDSDELEEDERVKITKGTAAVITFVGFGLIVYGLV